MTAPAPTLLVPGLLCSARLYEAQLPALWRLGPVTVADHTRGTDVAGVARRILDAAPPRFALVGLSMGGYVAFEILRQAGERVTRLALLDTTARPDTPEQTERRRAQIGLAEAGRFAEILDALFPALVHTSRGRDARLRAIFDQMAAETGPEVFVRQQHAIISRPDSRPDLAAIGCPTVVVVGDDDRVTPRDRAEEMARGIRGAELVTVADCGHLSTIEQPDAVTRALVAFLRA